MPNAENLLITDELIRKVQTGSEQMTEANATALAGELYGRGKFKQAVNVCRQILQHRPNIADAHNILGVSLAALGRGKDGIAALRRAIRIAPKVSSYRANLGEILRVNGDLPAATGLLNEALRLDPKNAQALNNLGIVCYERKEYGRAVEHYRAALAIDANMPEAWNNLGNSLRLIDDIDGARAAYENALAGREAYPEAYNNLGTLLKQLDKSDQAEHALKKAIAQNPRYVDAYNNLASIYHAQKQDVEALRQLGEVLKFEPENPKTLLLVARIQLHRSSYELAEQACKIVLRNDPQSCEAFMVLGQLKHDIDQYDEAVALLEKAVSCDPENAEARNFYGVTLKSMGRLDEAREQILKSIDLDDKMFGAYANLNDLVTFTKDDPLFKKIEAFLTSVTDQNAARNLPLHFAYAAALDDIGEPQRALKHYISGGQIKRSQLNYVEEETFAFFDKIIEAFPASVFLDRPYQGNLSEQPVFIVGMPRSGSTLVEQILSSHPGVHGAGEVKYLSREIRVLRDRFPSLSSYPELLCEVKDSQFELLAGGYLRHIAGGSNGAARVTDKLLTNYFFVGLINLLFPNAKIINTQRNPVDNCLSAFTKLFKDDMPHSYDLGELGRYYLKYEKLMSHWGKVLPTGKLMTIHYEDVVNDTEKLARSLVEFIGLPWDPVCLKFHDSDRPVKTASVAQIRKPIYKDAINRWVKYGPGLQPLLDALDWAPEVNPAPAGKPDRASKSAKGG